MRRILLGAAVAAMMAGLATAPVPGLGPLAARAQTSGNPFQPLVYVNNGAVTAYEVDQRMRFMQILRAPETGRDAGGRPPPEGGARAGQEEQAQADQGQPPAEGEQSHARGRLSEDGGPVRRLRRPDVPRVTRRHRGSP